MRASLYLESGAVLEGRLFGARKMAQGEVVFHTGMTGYQELLTDPSYVNQMVVFTYPQIGNYGFNRDDVESVTPKVNALIVREICREPSNFRSEGELEVYFQHHGIVGIEGIDTRWLTLHIREHGVMKGSIVPENESFPPDPWNVRLPDPVGEVTSREIWKIGDETGLPIALLDFGVRDSVLHALVSRGFRVTFYPAFTSADRILQDDPSAILLSNGPGNPADVTEVVNTIRSLLEARKPVMGVCLGHQLLCLACGAKTRPLHVGHRGSSQPVKNLETGKIAMTLQNHGYVVDQATLPSSLLITHQNLNDGTVEGIRHRHLPAFSVQYQPGIFAGPEDFGALLEKLQKLIRKEEIECPVPAK